MLVFAEFWWPSLATWKAKQALITRLFSGSAESETEGLNLIEDYAQAWLRGGGGRFRRKVLHRNPRVTAIQYKLQEDAVI